MPRQVRSSSTISGFKRQHGQLHRGDVPPEKLIIKQRVSKRIREYTQENLNVAALQRAADQGLELHPGQDVRFIDVDDNARRQERVRVHFEELDRYDIGYYSELLIRAYESVLSPLGWEHERIRRYVHGVSEMGLSAFE